MYATCVQTKKGASSGDEHSVFYGTRQGQGGVGTPRAVVPSSVGETVPPNQAGYGPRVGREGVNLQIPATSEAVGPHTGAAGNNQL